MAEAAMEGVSRTLWEEVTFDDKTVTSVDWLSYPILDITETPEQVDVVLINHPDLPRLALSSTRIG